MRSVTSLLSAYPMMVRCLTFSVTLVLIGAIALVLDGSEGTYFLVSLLGAVLGFPSVWLLQEAVWGLEEYLSGHPSTLYTTILGVGLFLNWFLIGFLVEVVRRLRKRDNGVI